MRWIKEENILEPVGGAGDVNRGKGEVEEKGKEGGKGKEKEKDEGWFRRVWMKIFLVGLGYREKIPKLVAERKARNRYRHRARRLMS